MKLTAIIVEDEAASREILHNYLLKYCPNVEILAEAASIDKALLAIKQYHPDLVFLDVEMPFGNAFDLLDKVGDRTFETIFVTAYNHYAIEALNNHASYYLLKPISIDELIKAVDYVLELKTKEEKLHQQLYLQANTTITGKITIPQQDGFEILEIADVIYCKANDNYTEIYTSNRKILASKTLKHFEIELKNHPFARIHKSYLVNINQITRYKKGKGGSVILKSGKELIVSASGKKELLSYF